MSSPGRSVVALLAFDGVEAECPVGRGLRCRAGRRRPRQSPRPRRSAGRSPAPPCRRRQRPQQPVTETGGSELRGLARLTAEVPTTTLPAPTTAPPGPSTTRRRHVGATTSVFPSIEAFAEAWNDTAVQMVLLDPSVEVFHLDPAAVVRGPLPPDTQLG